MTYEDFLRLVRDRLNPTAPFLCLLLNNHWDNPDLKYSPHAPRLLTEIKILLRTDPGNVIEMAAGRTVTLFPVLLKRYGWLVTDYELRIKYLDDRIAQEEAWK